MTYGKIDVFWPDGPVECYTVTKPTTAIGRSSGNDIVLDTTSISRYHISLTMKDQQMVLEDLESVNGTYIDGERVKAKEPRVLHGGEEVQIGDLRVIYTPEESDLQTRPNQTPTEWTQPVEIQHQNFTIELQPPEMPVTPGTNVQSTLHITNTSSQTDHYKIEVEGLPKAWVRLERTQVEIPAAQDAEIIISIKPLRRSDSVPGDYTVKVRVKADSAPEQPTDVQIQVRVLSFSGFGIALATPHIETGELFAVHIHNQGSAPLPLNISGRAPGGDVVFDLRPSTLTLAPGERQVLRGRLRPRKNIVVGAGNERRFDVLVQSADACHFLTAVSGTVKIKPILPVWAQGLSLAGMIGIPLLMLALIGGLGLLIIGRLNSAPTPTAVTAALNSATNATMPAVFKVNSFTVEPNPVLRNVSQDVTIRWDVSGAQSVRFEGLDALTGNPNNSALPASGSITLHGTPRDALSLNLIAVGPNNTPLTQPITVEIATPNCKTIGNATSYSGPSTTAFQPIGIIAPNIDVAVDGRDTTSTWVHRVPSPDLEAWLPVSVLQCTDFAPSALTLIEQLPTATGIPTVVTSTAVPPSATMTLTPTVTSTLTPIVVPSQTSTEGAIIIRVINFND